MRMAGYGALLALFSFLTILLFDLLHELSVEYAKLHEAGVKRIDLKIDVKGKR